jgi:hypothetical protein
VRPPPYQAAHGRNRYQRQQQQRPISRQAHDQQTVGDHGRDQSKRQINE